MKKQKKLESLKNDLNLFDSAKVYSGIFGGDQCSMTGPKDVTTNRNGSTDKQKMYDIVCA